MGVQCKLLGHVYDSTEFEERRETRPNGTVLICREYQVCRRCGDREEMYRNEQALVTESDARTVDATNDTGSSENESETNQPDQRSERDTVQATGAGPDGPDGERRDAVILPDSPTNPGPSTADTATEPKTDGMGHSLIGCNTCGREWRRDTTSLREGDLCPGCRKAYVDAG